MPKPKQEEEEEYLFVFNDTIEGPRIPGRYVRAGQTLILEKTIDFRQIKKGTTNKLRTRGRRFNCPPNH